MEMKPAEFILERQLAWAHRHAIPLVGSKGERGRRVYAKSLDGNLFEPLSADARAEYGTGDGGELGRPDGDPGKMQAIHSSSALCCNLFHYWRRIERVDVIARACGLPDAKAAVAFERKMPIDSQFPRSPNLDAVFRHGSGSIDMIGVESKFCEPFSTRAKPGLKPAYLDDRCAEFWRRMPRLHKLAETVCPENGAYEHLDAPQLLKHILGLSRNAKRFQLLYVYYAVPGRAGSKHADEIEKFISVATQDRVDVVALTYQDVIGRLLTSNRVLPETGREGHTAYLNYVAERYL
jgi:hypothetical protein